MAFYPAVPVDDSKIEKLLTLSSYYNKIYDEADKLYFNAESMDKRDVSKSIAIIRDYDGKIYQLTGESLVSNQLSLLSYSYETESSSNLFDIILKILSIVVTALLGISIFRTLTRPKDTLTILQHRPVKDSSDHAGNSKEYYVSSALSHDFHGYITQINKYQKAAANIINLFHGYSEDIIKEAIAKLEYAKGYLKLKEEKFNSPDYKNNGNEKTSYKEKDHEREGDKVDISYRKGISGHVGLLQGNEVYCTDSKLGDTGVVILNPQHPEVTDLMRKVVENIDHVENAVKYLSNRDIHANGLFRHLIILVRFKSSEKMDIIVPSSALKDIDESCKHFTDQVENAIKSFDRLSKDAINHNKELQSCVERLSKLEIEQRDMWEISQVMGQVREAGALTTGIVSDLHALVKGLRIKPYY